MKTVLLADVPEVAPELAGWFVEAWEPYYGPDGPGDAARDLAESRNRDSLPLAVVAMDSGGRPVGTAALKAQSVASYPDLTPWLAALLVHPARRHQGIGRSLVRAIEAEARRLGFKTLYAGMAETRGSLLQGWSAIAGGAPTLRDPVTVFRRDLA